MSLPLAILQTGASLLLAARSHTFSIQLSTSTIQAVLALIAGVLVLIRPKNVNVIVAAYLIAFGIVSFFQFSF